MKKRIVSLLMALVLAATLLPVQVWGATVVDSGYCGGEGDGKNLTWTLDSDGVLTISGKGKMKNYSSNNRSPWNLLNKPADRIVKQVVISSGVTTIGNAAFRNCDSLTDTVLADSITSIGTNITSITLPSTVKKIGTCAFNGCSGLAEVYYLDRESQWENVKANTATGNTPLLNARIHFVQDGDINGSFGAPDVNDVQCLYTYLASGDILGAYKNNAEMFTSLADVNMDSTVDVYDLQLLYENVCSGRT